MVEVRDGVFISALPQPADLVGFDRVVCLVPGHETLGFDGTVLYEPIVDYQTGTMAQLQRVVAFIEQGAAAGEKTVVHCVGGKGRSGMAVAAWLVSRGVRPDRAISEVRAVRPGAVETPEQEARVAEFR